ncbi:MAG TPA: N-acetylmuramoyl-L-alanine amidase [Chthoniobacterales bacterium]|jgi:N-acetylmuramoyl-L-alanine amidase
MRTALALFGLAVMAVCLVWLESIPRPERPIQPATGASTASFPVVVLDPGHGGKDSGAMCAGIMEKDLTLDVAQRVERRLHDAGFSTMMTRAGDNYISLADRAATTNRLRDCILISIHFNEGNKPVSSGIETYYAERHAVSGPMLASWFPFLQRVTFETSSLESQSLAGFIQDALVTRTHAVNRGTKTEQFFVLANVRHPAVLVEGGFISNKEDAGKLGNPEYREMMAEAINEGILRYRDVLRNGRQEATPSTE